MDGDLAELRAKLDRLLEETAAISAALSQADGTIEGVPHYSVIEDHAHQLGKRLSRLVQARQAGRIRATQPRRHRCPDCGSICESEIRDRHLASLDGDLKAPDLVGHCRGCRRDFFPSP